jgi:hypothetical protein
MSTPPVRKTAALLILAGFICLAANAFPDEKARKDDSNALLSSSLEMVNLCKPGAPPFRLRARIRLAFEKPSEGTYTLLWSSPEK